MRTATINLDNLRSDQFSDGVFAIYEAEFVQAAFVSFAQPLNVGFAERCFAEMAIDRQKTGSVRWRLPNDSPN